MTSAPAWNRSEFEAQLRARGAGYHINHPFNVRMNSGLLREDQIRGWVANRFYYQVNIPRKDGAIIANCPDRETRRKWVRRILDHDGWDDNDGGIEAWLRLGAAVGIEDGVLWSQCNVVPGVRFAVDAYVNFARQAPWQEAVCSSLTEMFAPQIHKDRLANWPAHYGWIDQAGLQYFRGRISLAERDVEHGLQVTLDHFTTRAQQERALDILWSMLDAIEKAYP
jgi:pyrroloquinoline-quinone synthase